MTRVRLTSSVLGARILAMILGSLPTVSLAAGSPHITPIKSVHQLIVDGNRPEISACLYAVQLAVYKEHEFESIRWSESISDESVVREYRQAGDWVRMTQFEANALTQGEGLFPRQSWVPILVECRQVNGKAPFVNLRRKIEKTAD